MVALIGRLYTGYDYIIWFYKNKVDILKHYSSEAYDLKGIGDNIYRYK
jgi:hypothetical protein